MCELKKTASRDKLLRKEEEKDMAQYTQEQKNEVLKKVAEVGAAKAAKECGVHYNTVLKWVKETKSDVVKEGKKKARKAVKKVEEVSAGTLEELNVQIAETEEEITHLTEALNAKKDELKELQKAKAKAEKIIEKEEAIKKEAAEKEQIFAALKNSDKSIDEILAFLK